jgi:serine/threonine protein kinase
MPAAPDVKAIFLVASEKAMPQERAAYLDEACGADTALRQRVEALLRAHDEPGPFLGESPRPAAGPATVAEAPAPGPDVGAVIAGRYKLLEQIGEGGMGTVWVGQQTEPIKRLVAVKLIKAGMDSKQVLARFEAERQALALMDHPNIARVLDAGAAPEGRPFFVMELVKGVPITHFCDQHRLTPRQRLELFVPVCQAIQHAHQKGVIHRDLKPSNFLVALYDDRPVPKVIDFGVAKAIGQQLTEQTLHTGFGAVVGTVEYMSPEQATFNQLDVDTRSDVYALGVLLYELLTGSPPFSRRELEKAGMLEMLRLIREKEPSRPSTRLSTADGLPTLAANRGTEPKRLTALVRGELDWIVMKALEKDRARRYETANSFAIDVQRYLADEPVQACPPSAGYRLRKFARRHRAALGAAVLVSLGLLAGTAVALWQAADARKNAETARKNESNAVAAKAALESANTELKQKREEVETALARSLLRPFARQPGPLTDLEVESLWELSASPVEGLRKRFVEEGLRGPMTTRQLQNRGEAALHAAVGLDPGKRTQIERLLGERLRDPALTDRQRGEVALVAVSLGGLTPAARAQAARTLIGALGQVTDPSALRELAEGLSSLATRMEPEEAARLCSQAATILFRTLAKSRYRSFEPLAQGLSALAARMEPREAARVCTEAAANLAETTSASGHSAAEEAFSRSLIFLAPYIEPGQAARAAAAIVGAMNGWGNGDPKPQALAALAARMEPEEAARHCSEAAAILTARMRDARHDSLLPEWVQGLRATAPFLKSGEASKAAEVLAEEITKAKSSDELGPLLLGVGALAPRMDPKEAARLFSPAAYAHMTTGNSLLIEGFSAAAIRMQPQDASIALLRAMEKAKHPSELLGFAKALSRVAARMGPREAARICSQAAVLLGREMEKEDKSRFGLYSRGLSAQGISAIAPYLEGKEARRVYSQAVASVLQGLAQMDSGLRVDEALLDGLAALAAHMQPRDAAQAAAIVNRALVNSWALQTRREAQAHGDSTGLVFHVSEIEALAKALSALAARLEPEEAARTCAQATEILVEALAKTNSFYGPRLARALSDLAGRLAPDEAARACARAAAILADSPSWVYPHALSALAARMEPRGAARVCFLAAANHLKVMAMGKPQGADPDVWAKGLSEGLSAVLTQFDPREQARQSSAVVSAVGLMAGTRHPPAAPAVLWTAWEPLPNRLSPQDLVELLKHPLCLGRARRIILDRLGSHYKHAFADLWAFVRYAQDQKLDLDLTNLPTLPAPSAGGE